MKLFNLLTKQENNTLKTYIETYVGQKPQNIKYLLRYWDKNKRNLYRLLGNELKVSKKLDCADKLPRDYFLKRVQDIYFEVGIIAPIGVHYWVDLFSHDSNLSLQDRFLSYVVSTMIKYRDIWGLNDEDICDFSLMTGYESIVDRYLGKNYNIGEISCTRGTKIMKAVRQVLERYFPEDEFAHKAFHVWRDKISEVFTDDTDKERELVLSIHPLDFLTLSHNDCTWSTCFNWDNQGCYSTALSGLMNSNMCIVAYLKSKNGTMRDFDIDNKSWRTLVFINKDICVVGKSYPYGSDIIEQEVLAFVAGLAKKNMRWEYKYENVPYRDLLPYSTGTRFDYVNSMKKSILLYCDDNFCYNDLLMDKDTEYLCNRNYVTESKKYSFLGQTICMHCGEKIEELAKNGDRSIVVCKECYQKAGGA